MGAPQPYRVSARAAPSSDGVPRSTNIGLSFAMYAFAAAIVLWIVNRSLIAATPPAFRQWIVLPVYAWTIDAAFLISALLCAWRGLPGTRVRLAALVVLVSSVAALATPFVSFSQHVVKTVDCHGELESITYDPAWPHVASAAARAVQWASLAWVVLEHRRRFVISRSPVLAAAAFAIVVTVECIATLPTTWSAWPTSHRDLSLAELVALVFFFVALRLATRAVRRTTPLDHIDRTNKEGPASESLRSVETASLVRWRHTTRTLGAAFFVVATCAAKAACEVCGISSTRSRSSYVEVAGIVLFAIAVEHDRRRSDAKMSTPPVVSVAAALAVVFAAMSASGVVPRFPPTLAHACALFAAAVVIVGIGMFFPPSPFPENKALAKSLQKELIAAGVFLGIAGVGALPGELGVIVLMLASLPSFAAMVIVLRRAAVIDRRVAITEAMIRRELEEEVEAAAPITK